MFPQDIIALNSTKVSKLASVLIILLSKSLGLEYLCHDLYFPPIEVLGYFFGFSIETQA